VGLENIEDIYRLSPVQHGMLFHTVYAPATAVYFEQFCPAYGQGFDAAAFERAWQQTLDRHPVLRTAFLWEDLEEPVQVVHRKVVLPVDHQDWRGLPAAEQRRRLAEYMAADRRRGFELARPPLLRLGVVRLGDEDWRVVWSYHHLLLDGWSAGLLIREVLAVYLAAAAGQAPRLEARRPFKDYILWLRQQDLASAEAYWRRLLAGFAEPTPLGVDAAPAGGGDGGAAYELRLARLAAAATARLKSFAQRHRLTLSTLVQGAWALLLSRYGDKRDVVFGVTVSGRPPALKGVDAMLGCFINTLPARVRVPPAAPLGGWLKELQASGLELRRFEHSPLREVLGWSEVPRQLPLFESIVVYEGFTADSTFEMTHSGTFQRTNYPLTLTASPGGEQLLLRVGYEAERFDSTAMLRVLRHLETLCEAIAGAGPERPLADLPLLSAAERQQVVREWNDTATEHAAAARRGRRARGRCLNQPFEEWAARAPDAPALVFAGETRTYGELERRANRLARLLAALGVGPGTLVGVHLERSCAMVEAVLAIHKAGGAYVPVECGWPAARVRWILASQGIAHVVTQASRVEALTALVATEAGPPGPPGPPPAPGAAGPPGPPPVPGAHLPGAAREGSPSLAHLVCVDGPPPSRQASGSGEAPAVWSAADVTALSGEALPARCGPDDLAYIIFTSGSTGNPKGVMVCHAPAVHLIEWVNRSFAVGPGDRLLFVTALSFDLSVYDVFGILAAGGTVRIASAAELQDPEAQVRILCGEPITFWDSAPAALQQLAPFFPAPGTLAAPPALRLVFQSGDWVPVTLPDRVREVFTRARFIALGGATEATVWSNFFPVAAVDPGWASIPYGRPIDDARYLVLDADANPCPIGVAGYLHIGGDDCLSSGYAQEPRLTAAQYVPCPFGEQPGERLYYTGDRVRRRHDGVMEFLGRVDTQVKVRGFRIELGEIESALSAHPAVREAVVQVLALDGHRRLVAYLVGKEEGGLPPAGELRAWLGERLPDYMLPAAWVVLPRLPLTPNGKLDRKALPAPDAAAGEGDYVPPRTPVEQELAAIWSAVLRRERVGVDENFFELGGDSILTLQVVSRASRAGLRVAPRQLFDHPTVARLAAALVAGAEVAAGEQGPVAGPLGPAPADASDDELRGDAVLDPAVRPSGPPAARGGEPAAVLLTGGSGFLGAYLLAELLRQTPATVVCLVRAADPDKGLAKLRRELSAYGLWDAGFAPRIQPLLGDLAQPALGLSARAFGELAGAVDAIVHNGAGVDFLAPYAALAAANVLGTREILRLACTGPAKPLHYVSTMAVLDSAAHAAAGPVGEDVPLGDCRGLRGGYAQSKWVAETLVAAARERGLPAVVYRPGTISGDSRSGAGNPKDFAISLVKSCIQLGAVPELQDEVNLAPVDFVARAIVWLSRQPGSIGKAFHLINPRPLSGPDFVAWLLRFGYPLERLSGERWRAALIDSVEAGNDNALLPFLPLFQAAATAAATAIAVGNQAPARQGGAPVVQYGCRATTAALAAGGVRCPPVDDELLGTYFRHLVETRMLPPPPGGVLPVRGPAAGAGQSALAAGRGAAGH